MPDGVRMADVIGKYENLEESLREISGILNLPPFILEHYNNGEYDKAWRKHYTSSAQVEAVAKLYADDLRTFGYAF
jgi:hypothetical protein